MVVYTVQMRWFSSLTFQFHINTFTESVYVSAIIIWTNPTKSYNPISTRTPVLSWWSFNLGTLERTFFKFVSSYSVSKLLSNGTELMESICGNVMSLVRHNFFNMLHFILHWGFFISLSCILVPHQCSVACGKRFLFFYTSANISLLRSLCAHICINLHFNQRITPLGYIYSV